MLQIGRALFFLFLFCDALLCTDVKGISIGVAGGLIAYEH
jgi:hypothetical protein